MEVLISEVGKADGVEVPEMASNDRESEYCKARAWPEWMSAQEKALRHEQMFGADHQDEGPPYHPESGKGKEGKEGKEEAAGEKAVEKAQMEVTVKAHPKWNFDKEEGTTVILCELKSRADLNGQSARLLREDKATGRWTVALTSGDCTNDCISIKPANFTLGFRAHFKVNADGSTAVRHLRQMVRKKIDDSYMSWQYSLWRGEQKLEVDTFDSDDVVKNTLLKDYGVDSRCLPVARTIEVKVSQIGNPDGSMPEIPQELDPDSEYCQKRAWPEWMSTEEKARRHEEMFGADHKDEGPPYHPDVGAIRFMDQSGNGQSVPMGP